MLGVPHATVELAEFQERRGSVSESFVSEDQDLFHGNQLLERTTDGYDPTVRRRHSDHAFENIWKSFERIFVKREAAEETKRAFACHLTLDAVIGNTDRHHENWGMLRRRVGEREAGGLGPSFDHASSLGRELLDRKRILRLDTRGGWRRCLFRKGARTDLLVRGYPTCSKSSRLGAEGSCWVSFLLRPRRWSSWRNCVMRL